MQTTTVTDVRKACQEIGDKMNATYNKKNDMKAGLGAIQAYSTAIKAAQSHLIYKKLTASPASIKFFESEE